MILCPHASMHLSGVLHPSYFKNPSKISSGLHFNIQEQFAPKRSPGFVDSIDWSKKKKKRKRWGGDAGVFERSDSVCQRFS